MVAYRSIIPYLESGVGANEPDIPSDLLVPLQAALQLMRVHCTLQGILAVLAVLPLWISANQAHEAHTRHSASIPTIIFCVHLSLIVRSR